MLHENLTNNKIAQPLGQDNHAIMLSVQNCKFSKLAIKSKLTVVKNDISYMC